MSIVRKACYTLSRSLKQPLFSERVTYTKKRAYQLVTKINKYLKEMSVERRERERESVCVCERERGGGEGERERECVCVCVCVCVREREIERETHKFLIHSGIG